MIEYDEIEQRMVLKLVYYGPAMSGKTTNLLRLHDILAIEGRGDLMTLDTKDDRTIFFDLLPFFFTAPGGLKIKVKVYTVPGQVRHDATRKAVLTRADGIAFIADSQISESANNVESFENLEKNLAFVGIDIEKIPLIIQFNKRDLKDIISEDEIHRAWESTGIPVFMASALYGQGVLETFRRLVALTYDYIDIRHSLKEKHMLTKEMFVDNLARLSADLAEQ
ncbi:MAG: GTPase domain-containing protein [Nitrospirae bacterium]|nr:GTPase domain-containing protein [Nitrospirota bacterium]MDA8214951.1 GTPase domain-containing protein [Nitrospiraceae bacterium]